MTVLTKRIRCPTFPPTTSTLSRNRLFRPRGVRVEAGAGDLRPGQPAAGGVLTPPAWSCGGRKSASPHDPPTWTTFPTLFDFMTLALSMAGIFSPSRRSRPSPIPLPVSTIPAMMHKVVMSVYSPVGRRTLLRPSGCNGALLPPSSSPGHRRTHRAASRCTLR
jgi:hypothetical protein